MRLKTPRLKTSRLKTPPAVHSQDHTRYLYAEFTCVITGCKYVSKVM